MKKLVIAILFLFIFVSLIGFVIAECTDSDNGVNYYVSGQVVVSENETSLSYNDACVYKLEETNAEFYVNYNGELYNNKAECSGDNCYVAEAFCENNAKKWIVKICPSGCSDGACLCPTTKCSDGTVYGPEKCSVINNGCQCPSCPIIVNETQCSSNADCPSVKGEQYCKDSSTLCGTVSTYSCVNGQCVASGGGLGCKVCQYG